MWQLINFMYKPFNSWHIQHCVAYHSENQFQTHFAIFRRCFNSLVKCKSNEILKIMCELMKKCVFLFSFCSQPSIFLSTQALFAIWCCWIVFCEREKNVNKKKIQTLFAWPEEKWQKRLQAVNINTHAFDRKKNMNNMYCKLNYLYIQCCLF